MNKFLQTTATFWIALTPAMATADDITLSFGETVVLTAEFAGFQDNAYIVVYNDQKLHVPAELVACQGPDCLNFEPISDITLAASDL